MVGPQGFQGGGANYSVPVAGGQLNVGASMDPRMKMAQMQAQYQRGPFSVGAQYQPGAGVSGGVSYRKAFAKGGLAMAEGGAWTRKEGQNSEGGLNAKGRASLKAQGKDIKPPVSAKQAKKSPKAAARRKSFCARMTGMEGPMSDFAVKPVWEKKRPKDLGKPKDLSVKKKKSAKARAKAAGRPFPNLIDNMAAARKKGK
jgi:hypothetical protein